jgi:2-polyprenyl-3-methyl-5-hydroxy-6-metoxy-1,4-benzoquinol methylase
MENETERLEHVADWFSAYEGFNGRLVRYSFEALRPHFRGARCLELGSADGQMTEMLLDIFDEVTSVDGSPTYVQQVGERIGDRRGFRIEQSLFEEYSTEQRFDTVVATHILEHVDDPVDVIRRALDWTAPDGRLVVAVPNALSIHRLVAVEMGLLADPHELNERDRRLGHRRVYDPDGLRGDLEQAGWTVELSGGVFLKVLTNAQIEEWFTPEMEQGFYRLGERFPQNSAEIYAVCSPG